MTHDQQGTDFESKDSGCSEVTAKITVNVEDQGSLCSALPSCESESPAQEVNENLAENGTWTMLVAFCIHEVR
jgi:hypothetical protein